MSIRNMPVDQRNARPAPGLVMRVGLPHRGGKLAFHAFNNDYPVMVSAKETLINGPTSEVAGEMASNFLDDEANRRSIQ